MASRSEQLHPCVSFVRIATRLQVSCVYVNNRRLWRAWLTVLFKEEKIKIVSHNPPAMCFPRQVSPLSLPLRQVAVVPGGIDGGQDHEEKEPVTDYANNNASPSYTHSSGSCRQLRTMHIGYFPFGSSPFFSSVLSPSIRLPLGFFPVLFQ